LDQLKVLSNVLNCFLVVTHTSALVNGTKLALPYFMTLGIILERFFLSGKGGKTAKHKQNDP